MKENFNKLGLIKASQKMKREKKIKTRILLFPDSDFGKAQNSFAL